MDYKQKYQKYKIKYNQLKYKNEIYNLLGGLCEPNKKFSYDDMSSVLDYVKNRYDCTDNKKTDKKYIVILYGPPASGKTISRKIACSYIKNHFNESMSKEDIYKSFIDTGVDDIVYDAYYKEEMPLSVKNKMKNTLDKFFEQKKIQPDQRLNYLKLFNHDVSEIINENNKIYMKYRREKNIDDLSALLGIIATYTNHNVFFEISSAYIEYINNVISTIYWNNYNVVFIYPYTDNIDLLSERSYLRGLNEGRIMSREYIDSKIKECYDGYQSKIINESDKKSIINIYKNIMILRYNTNLPNDLYNKINKFIIDDDFKIYIYEFKIKKT
jgi:hypothetical protein